MHHNAERETSSREVKLLQWCGCGTTILTLDRKVLCALIEAWTAAMSHLVECWGTPPTCTESSMDGCSVSFSAYAHGLLCPSHHIEKPAHGPLGPSYHADRPSRGLPGARGQVVSLVSPAWSGHRDNKSRLTEDAHRVNFTSHCWRGRRVQRCYVEFRGKGHDWREVLMVKGQVFGR